MSTWRLPAAALATVAGLLLWPHVGGLLPAGLWLLLGGGLVIAGLLLVRPCDGRRWVPVGPVVVVAGVMVASVGWAGVHAGRTEGALLRRLAPAHVVIEGGLRIDPRARIRGWSVILDASLVRWDERAARIDEAVWVSASDGMLEAVRGDRIRVEGILRVPDDLGFARSLEQRGIVAELSVGSVRRLGASSNPLIRAAQSVRQVVGASIRRSFPPREAGLLLGLALGDDSGLDEGLERDFRATGLGHLLVVSGGNVAMVLAPVMAGALALRLSRWWRFSLGLSTVVFFVVLTGAEPSVLRAGVMAGLALTGSLLGSPRSAGNVLAGAVLLLLVLDPALVWSVGFQLSAIAAAAMIAAASPLADRLWFLPRPLALATGATLAAQLGVTPLLLYHFHEVPLSTLLANVLAFPAVSPGLLLGLAAAGLGLLAPALGGLIVPIALLPLRYLEAVADRLSTAPVPWITSAGGIGVLVVGLCAVALAARWLRSGRRIPAGAVVVALGLLPWFVWRSALTAGPPDGLTVRFLDVGQGDAALITSPGGATVLIDAGPDEEQVATDLAALGVKRIDVAVATHPHADHVAGFPAVFGRFPVGVVLEPGCDEPSPSYEALLRAIEDEELTVRHPRAGETLVAADVHLEVLAPPACASGTASDANNDSIVLRVSRGGDSVLFPGDAEEPSQRWLLDAGVALAADVLKVPHHGGDTSFTPFFAAVSAKVAVVSVGQPNDYGHPVQVVLDAIRATGARVLRTDVLGDVVVTFAPEGLLLASAA